MDAVFHLFQHKPCVGELVQQVEIMVNGETLSILKLFLPCRRTLNILCCCYFFCQLLFKKLGVKGTNCS